MLKERWGKTYNLCKTSFTFTLFLTCHYHRYRFLLTTCTTRSTPHLSATSALLSRSCKKTSAIYRSILQSSLDNVVSHWPAFRAIKEDWSKTGVEYLVSMSQWDASVVEEARNFSQFLPFCRHSHPYRPLHTPFAVKEVTKIPKHLNFLYSNPVSQDIVSTGALCLKQAVPT